MMKHVLEGKFWRENKSRNFGVCMLPSRRAAKHSALEVIAAITQVRLQYLFYAKRRDGSLWKHIS